MVIVNYSGGEYYLLGELKVELSATCRLYEVQNLE
jgi:hypothetical protein